jgi:hypothetical protein
MDLLVILHAMLSPLSLPIVLAAMTAGLFFGRIYNRRNHLPDSIIYHKMVTGWGFLFFMFLFRGADQVLAGKGAIIFISFFGWIGVGILWTIFIAFIWIGKNKIP